MTSPQASAPGSAKAALTSACRVLSAYGIHLEAETLRQAKFNTPAVSSAMVQAVHDLVLLNILWTSGLPTDPDAAAPLRAASLVWKEVQQEGLSGMTTDGLLLMCYYLQLWGCPRQIVQDLEQAAAAAAAAAADAASAPSPSELAHDADAADAARFVDSRPCLLALAWLLRRCRLFEAALEALHPRSSCRALAPPFPADSCCCEATRDAYLQALQQAQAHSSKVLELVQQQPEPAAGAAADERSWSRVEAAAHAATMMLGRARARLSSLQSLLDCRLKLQQALRHAQPAVGSALTPLELHLLQSKRAMEAHLQALAAATDAVAQQHELATCARLFYSWMTSVVAEEAKARGVVPADAPAARAATAAPGLAVLESLQRLPECGSHASTSLLQHLDQQLQEAVEVTQPYLSASRTSERLSVYQTSGPSSQAKAKDRERADEVNMAHFQRLASQALTTPVAVPAFSSQAGQQDGSRASSPTPGTLAKGDWSMPADVTDRVRQMAGLQSHAGRCGDGRPDLSDVVHASSCLKHEVQRPEDSVGQQRSHHTGEQQRSPLQPAHWINGVDESDRLLRSALQSGKALAQTRAASKQALLQGLAQMPSHFRKHWPC